MKIIKTSETFATKWLCLKQVDYEDKSGKEQKWDYISRNHFNGVVTLICRSRRYGKILFISQPRVSINKIEISFPAGLVDKGETPKQAALRELKEETGYAGGVTRVDGPFAKSAGLSDETTYYVECNVNEKSVGKTEMESTEDIQSFWKTPLQFMKWAETLDPKKYSIAAEVWFFLQGILLKRKK